MIGDAADMLARLRMVLPARWFADSAPVLDALFGGFAAAWSGLYALLAYVIAQSRIATANGILLDIAAVDFCPGGLPRRTGEADTSYSLRIRSNLLPPRATRASVVSALTNLTGRAPDIFEPFNATDTGGYNINLGFNTSGGYGSANLPFQFFVTAFRPDNTPVSNAGGYGTGPGGYQTAPLFYADSTEFPGNISDADIFAALAAVLPTATIAWTKISN